MTKRTIQLVFVVLLLFIQNEAYSQWTAGGGLNFGTQSSSIGLNLRAQKNIMEKIDGAASFNYFFSGNGLNLWSLNADGHYDFAEHEKFQFYGIGGLNFTRGSYNVGFFNGGGSHSRLGLNVGAGADMALTESLDAFGELKYVLSGWDQLVLTAGVLFPLGK